MTTSNTDLVRFLFTRAPRSQWSSSLMSISEFTVDRFMDNFKHHLQSDAKELLNKDWSTKVYIFTFPNKFVNNRPKVKSKKQDRMYKCLDKGRKQFGGGKLWPPS